MFVKVADYYVNLENVCYFYKKNDGTLSIVFLFSGSSKTDTGSKQTQLVVSGEEFPLLVQILKETYSIPQD